MCARCPVDFVLWAAQYNWSVLRARSAVHSSIRKRYLMTVTVAITLPLISAVLPSKPQSRQWERGEGCEEDTYGSYRTPKGSNRGREMWTGRERGRSGGGFLLPVIKVHLLWSESVQEAGTWLNNALLCCCLVAVKNVAVYTCVGIFTFIYSTKIIVSPCLHIVVVFACECSVRCVKARCSEGFPSTAQPWSSL